MHPPSTVMRRWIGVLLALVLLVAPSTGPIQHAAAADGSLVVAALHVLEQEYVDPVNPVQVLNAAIAALRKATNLSADQLPDIAEGTPEANAQDDFITEFARAARTGVMSETQLAYAATTDMLASLHDSSTSFIDPSQLRERREQVFGADPSIGSIGATLTLRKDSGGVERVFLQDVFPGSPAQNAGLKRFDKILEIDGKTLTNVNTTDAIQLLRGPAGSTVNLLIQRTGQTLRVPIVRAPIRMPPVEAESLQPGVVYVRIFEFLRGAGDNARSALEHMGADQPIRSIILDLRSNPGGLVSEAVRVGSIFLPPRTVLAMIRERGGQPSVLRTFGAPLLPRTPLVILVDGSSAGASEIVTGAFKEDQRATIVGDQTMGALGGSVTVSLPEGAMSVTVERILTPRGEQVEGVGITPDISVALTVADMERGDDTQLQAAVHAPRGAWRVRSTPLDPLLAYLNTIVLPAAKGQPLTDEALKAFYEGDHLLPSTRVQVGEDQFVEYWKNVVTNYAPGAAHVADADYALSEPMYNDANDEALITSDLTVAVAQTQGLQLFAILVAIGCAASGTSCTPMTIGGRRLTEAATTYRIVKLRDTWRLELPPDIVRDIQKLPTKITAKRYAPNASVTEGGLTLWASEVALDRDVTTVRLAVENTTDYDLNLFNAVTLAILTDEHGETYRARALRTSFPDHLPQKSSVEGYLAFEPVPVGTNKLQLAFPEITVGDQVVTLKLEIMLTP